MPSFECKDIGLDCGWKATAKNDDALMKKITQHAKKDHGMKEFSPDMVQKVKGAIKA